MRISLYLMCLWIGHLYAFEFLIESGKTTFTSALKVQEFELIVDTGFTLTQLTSFQTKSVSMLETFLATEHFKNELIASKTLGIKSMVSRSLAHVGAIAEVGASILKYTGSTASTTSTSACKLELPGVTAQYLEDTTNFLQNELSRIKADWVMPTDTSTDMVKTSILINFVQSFEAEMVHLWQKLTQQLNIIDTLFSYEFPASLYGIYHNTACLGIIKNEQISVKQCTAYSDEIQCTIELWYPETTQTLSMYVPVSYNNIRLAGSLGENIFVKTALGNHYQVLNCQQNMGYSNKQEVCTLNRLEQDCEQSLINQEIDNIIKYCKFIKDKSAPVSRRLADKNILIEDRLAKVTVTEDSGKSIISTPVPYVVTSPNTVTVESNGLTITYPGNGKSGGTKIVNSSLSDQVLNKLFTQLYFVDYWEMLQNFSLVDIILLSLQIIAMIIIAIGTYFYKQLSRGKIRSTNITREQNRKILHRRVRNYPMYPLQQL